MQPAPPPPSTPLLWERLRALFERVIAVVGAPAIIATMTIAPGIRASLIRQIGLVEILVRKLLLAEVAALGGPQPQRGPRIVEHPLRATGLYTLPPTRRKSEAKPRAVDFKKPESWSAGFSLAIPREQRSVAERNAPRIRSFDREPPRPSAAIEPALRQRNSDAFLIARRAEALRRVLHDPAPYVARLARSRRIGRSPSRQSIQRYALRAPRRFIGDRLDPRLTLDVFMAAVHAHAVLTDTS